MDTQQLQLISETIKSIGSNGQTAFIWYLVMEHIPSLFGWLMTLITTYIILKLFITECSYDSLLEEIARSLGYDPSGYFNRDWKEKTIMKIQELIKNSKSLK